MGMGINQDSLAYAAVTNIQRPLRVQTSLQGNFALGSDSAIQANVSCTHLWSNHLEHVVCLSLQKKANINIIH